MKHREKANFVPTSYADYEQSTEAINLKPTPGTAPGPQLLGEVITHFCQPFCWTAYFDKLSDVKRFIFCQLRYTTAKKVVVVNWLENILLLNPHGVGRINCWLSDISDQTIRVTK